MYALVQHARPAKGWLLFCCGIIIGQALLSHIQSDPFVLRDSQCVEIWEPAFCMGIRDFISQCCLRNTIRIKGMADYFGGRGVFQRAGADVPYSETLSCYVTPCVLIYKNERHKKD